MTVCGLSLHQGNTIYIASTESRKNAEQKFLLSNLHFTLMMTSAQVVETSVTVTDNSPFQDFPDLAGA